MANLDLVNEARQQAEARRLVLNEKLSKRESSKLEFGDYQAFWRGITDSGRGSVLYNGKIYNAKILGSSSIPLNAGVRLTVAEYDFFVDW